MLRKKCKKDLIALILISCTTLIAIVVGLYYIPSPAKLFNFNMDHMRVIDIGEIQSTISDYYQNNSSLPKQLNDLYNNAYDPSQLLPIKDPQSGKQYVYEVVDSSDYKLCAQFSTDSTSDDPNAYDDKNNDYALFKDAFSHPAGFYCFSENVAPIPPPPAPTTAYHPCPIPPCGGVRYRQMIMCPMVLQQSGTISASNGVRYKPVPCPMDNNSQSIVPNSAGGSGAAASAM